MRGAQIPYAFAANAASNTIIQSRVAEAIWRYHTYTTVRFVPRTTETDYIEFSREDGICSSPVGRVGGVQTIKLDGTGLCALGETTHEIGHSLGLYHTMARTDRDNYITVNLANVNPNNYGDYYKYTQLCPSEDCGQDYGDYDYASLMHYKNTDFLKAGARHLRSECSQLVWAC